MSTPGRPRALNEVKQREICALVSAGCSLREAARYVRCGRATIQRELTRNPDFRRQIDEAAVAAQISPLKAMQKAAGTHWRAAAWLLERTKPERYARRDPRPLRQRQSRRLLTKILEIVQAEVNDSRVTTQLQQRIGDAFDEAVPGTTTKRRDGQRQSETSNQLAEPASTPSANPGPTLAPASGSPPGDPFLRRRPIPLPKSAKPMSTLTVLMPAIESEGLKKP